MCDDGLSVEVCAYLSVYYSGWRNNPRPAQPSVSQEQWTNAYEKSLLVLQELFENVADNDDVKLLPERFRSRMGIPKKTGRQHIRDVYPLYAVGRGENRTYKTPFALTLRQSSLIHLLPKLGYFIQSSHTMLTYFRWYSRGILPTVLDTRKTVCI